ncbi:methionine ABC transporter ATP-binding protein [Negativibacillus massiliensis]|uniref:methionine ABC transporter ATP-binding protein n=1 Tax=Negativibacillus massiliensis TaxID=1871035 RepID=UPI002A81E930|nr:methionine ABC transporter ATP-binding protein [Negativibacillus massiliensis]MDY4047446.1 methionine ABC transporter ATP-binding protein [Negativibacillus massiliensis]
MIRIKNLSKTFDKSCNVDALKNVNLSIEAGDVCGVIGMSGAGKSTLLRCIAMLETPSSGSIEIDGRDIFSLKGKELLDLKKSLGVVFQGYNLLMQRSIRQNIAFPLELIKMPKDQIAKRVDKLLRLVGLSDKAEEYPSQLSGGQRQRVAIARALASNPKVLLCDEPTSALDPLTTRSILKLLREINHTLGVTIVIITHEIGVVRSICNKVAVIDAGEIAESGLTKEVFAAPQSQAAKQLLDNDF